MWKRRDNNIKSIKMKVLPFKGKNDIAGYLEWECKLELFFKFHNSYEEKNVKLVAVVFTNYALIW